MQSLINIAQLEAFPSCIFSQLKDSLFKQLLFQPFLFGIMTYLMCQLGYWQRNDIIGWTSFYQSFFFQMLCSEFISRYGLDDHIAGIRRIYAHKSSLMLSELDKNMPDFVHYTRPQGGLFIPPFDGGKGGGGAGEHVHAWAGESVKFLQTELFHAYWWTDRHGCRKTRRSGQIA